MKVTTDTIHKSRKKSCTNYELTAYELHEKKIKDANREMFETLIYQWPTMSGDESFLSPTFLTSSPRLRRQCQFYREGNQNQFSLVFTQFDHKAAFIARDNRTCVSRTRVANSKFQIS